MEGFADNDLVHFVLQHDTAENFQVGFQVLSAQCRPGLRSHQKCVADSDSDGFVADVEGHNPHVFHDTIARSSKRLGGSI